ncbi:nuclear mitotic apparatus protein 1-like [Triplophysa rosa]|uniref:nuclear mitotic apparatus protein 1-like n=1 Tax=Triplophysa rosa TaxID=992332 RepID=UPI00254612F9|nr:nuclear mitotic apparatus protein 1-like [Triplophysa rosa]
MELSKGKEAALLSWINSVCPVEPIAKIIHVKDGHQLRRFTYKVQGKVPCETMFVPPFSETMEIIINILQDDFYFSRRQSSLISQKISQEIDLELQLAKVLLVLCYCGFKENNFVPDLDVKSELMMASMFRFVKDDVDGLSLDEGLDKFLTKDSVLNLSSSSESSIDSPFFTGDESWFFGPHRVQYQRLLTVACTSVSSPVQDTTSTPHFQLERLRKELARVGDVRDELEKELANQISIISEKEGVISQLHHRLNCLLWKTGEIETDHNARVLELQEKNDSLVQRVHEVVKQCQDFKTSSSQKGKKIDELTEENVTLVSQVRNSFAQLARAEEEIAKLTLAHEMSQSVWKDKREFLEKELSEAFTHKEVLSEHVQILQGKISVLEDELQKAQSQESGEVLGPSLEALTKIESLQTQILELTEQISTKDNEKTHLKKECDSLDHELKLVREQNIKINNTLKIVRKDHEDTMKKLQQDLCCAAVTASKKQEEVLVLSAEVTRLKDYNENKLQKQQEFSVLEAEHKVMKKNMTSLQNRLTKATTAQKEPELTSLQQQLCHQETLRKTAQDFETVKCEEFKRKVSELQAKILEVSSLASEREARVSSLQDEMKSQERLRDKLKLKVEKQSDSILALKIIARKWEQQCKELLEKLKMMSERLQQYSDNKHQLTEAQEMNKFLENSLEASRREIKALETELTLARMERDQEKAKVKHLETELNFSYGRLREKMMSDDIYLLRVPETWQDTSADSSESEFNADRE